jgi:hypothetical protein
LGRWASILAILCLALAAGSAQAEDKDVVVVQWVDHFTYGLPNTVVGLLYGATGTAFNRIFDSDYASKPGVRLDRSGQQIVLEGSGWVRGYEQNSGLFHFSKHSGSEEEHEAGHGKQSGLLGPLHLIANGTDFLIEGYHPDDLI